MFRKSRCVLTAVLFFFLTGTLTAYGRCLEDSRSSWNQWSEIENGENERSRSDTESLHCPDDLRAYATGKLTNLNKQQSKVKQEANHLATSCTKLADPFTSRISLVSSLSLSPYRLVPVYQLKVVYRI